jgi:VRR-NUC domain-containing protein
MRLTEEEYARLLALGQVRPIEGPRSLVEIVPEKRFQAQLLQVARLAGWIAYYTFDSRRSPEGFPDVILVRPEPGRGPVYAWECKTAHGKLKMPQQLWLRALDGKRVDASVKRACMCDTGHLIVFGITIMSAYRHPCVPTRCGPGHAHGFSLLLEGPPMLDRSTATAVLDDVLAPEDDNTAAREETSLDDAMPVLSAKVLMVTPAIAEGWLTTRHPNRRIVPARVQELAALMRQGAWHLNGESIILDERGTLLDGQHRLSALVQSGTTLPCLVVQGVPVAVQSTLGQAIQRSRADILAMHGEGNSKTVAGALSWLWKYDRGLMGQPKRSYATQDTLTVLLHYPGLAASVSWGRSVQRFLPGSLGGMLHWLFHQRDAALAKHVFQRLKDGLELTSDNPLYALRERLIESRTRLPRPQPWVLALWAIRCWNALRNHGGVPTLPWSPEIDLARFPHVQ